MNKSDLDRLEGFVWELVICAKNLGRSSSMSVGHEALEQRYRQLEATVETSFVEARGELLALALKRPTDKPRLLHSVYVTEEHFAKIMRWFKSKKRKEGIFFVTEEIISGPEAGMVWIRIFAE